MVRWSYLFLLLVYLVLEGQLGCCVLPTQYGHLIVCDVYTIQDVSGYPKVKGVVVTLS